MRGGKRENAGRKSTWNSKTKVYRLPIELEPQIMELAEQYKSSNSVTQSKDTVTKSIDRIKPSIIKLTEDQLERLRMWLIKAKIAKSKTEARKMTENQRLTKENVQRIDLEFEYEEGKWIIWDIVKLYRPPIQK